MSLNKAIFDRETNITAKVICDSISPDGQRITTMEVEAPRIILAEINTHRGNSKNCSSTRAINLAKAIKQVIDNPFVPVYWGSTKSGMQAGKEAENVEVIEKVWKEAMYNTIDYVEFFGEQNIHKQIAGRLLEPFQMVKQVMTSTDWNNFFNLRLHPDAQPEICMLAHKMYQALAASTPDRLREGEWHLPYITTFHDLAGVDHNVYSVLYYDSVVNHTVEQVLTLEEAIKVSASSCAQVSYRNTDMSLKKADKIYQMLVKADVMHASALEHQATPIKKLYLDWYDSDDHDAAMIERNLEHHPDSWDAGITHMNRNGALCSGNFVGWIQHRHLLPNNTCWEFNFDERMKLFA